MLKKISLLFSIVMGFFYKSHAAYAQIFSEGRDLPKSLDDAGADMALREMMMKIINWILGFVGILAVAMLIYGGFLLLFSQGEETEKPRNIILYAVIGILVIIFSFAIVQTVFEVTAGGDMADSPIGN